jgi:hypothetical protein
LEGQKVKLETREALGKASKVTFMALEVDPEAFPKTFMTFWTDAERVPPGFRRRVRPGPGWMR